VEKFPNALKASIRQERQSARIAERVRNLAEPLLSQPPKGDRKSRADLMSILLLKLQRVKSS
jgi:hypothetical protein